MTDTTAAWVEVGDRLERLSLKLKLHAEEELGDDVGTVTRAIDRLRALTDDLVEALDDACHDPAVRSDAVEAVASIGRALGTTIDAAAHWR